MRGMRRSPQHVYREVMRRPAAPGMVRAVPNWYAVWLGPPHRPGSVRLGRVERLEKYPEWRAYPESPELPRVLAPFTAAEEWLLEVWRGVEATSDQVTGTEYESVRVI